MQNVYFRKQTGFVPSNLLWKNLKRHMANDSQKVLKTTTNINN